MAASNDNTSKRGFAAMPKSKVKKIAQQGGEASHSGRGHSSNRSSSSSETEQGNQSNQDNS